MTSSEFWQPPFLSLKNILEDVTDQPSYDLFSTVSHHQSPICSGSSDLMPCSAGGDRCQGAMHQTI